MCCGCGGGSGAGSYDDGGCVDTDYGATDSYGDGCYWYANSPWDCGLYDDDDFSSMDMCCGCSEDFVGPLDPIDCDDGYYDEWDWTCKTC